MLYEHTQVLRVLIPDKPGAFGRLATAIGQQDANIGDVRFIKRGTTHNMREIEITVRDEAHLARVAAAVRRLGDIRVERLVDPVLEAHRGGKIRVASRVTPSTSFPPPPKASSSAGRARMSIRARTLGRKRRPIV